MYSECKNWYMEDKYKKVLEWRSQRVNAIREDLEKLFSAPENIDRKFTFELGCGKGHYLSSYGLAFPKEICIGIDIISSRVRDSRKKVEKNATDNVYFFKAEGNEFLEALPKGKKFHKIIIMFPDPWPKKRHHKHRIIQTGFMKDMYDNAEEGAMFYFRTDSVEYFDWTKNIVEQSGIWEILVGENLPFEEETQFQKYMDSWQTLVAKKK